jgi:tetratricopeptide (TPR) repeat protein
MIVGSHDGEIMSAKTEQNRPDLAAALSEVHKTPEREELWTRLEALAADWQRPDEVAELYRQVLRQGTPELAALLGQRAVRFHEEWFGAQADELVEILMRVLEADPTTGWALRRLSVLYTVKERWADLLALYDRSLAAIDDVSQRREVLQEAAHVAKDFVGDTDRAIGYMLERHRLSPGDTHLATQLERLLERQGRFRELAAMWAARLPTAGAPEARGLRVRRAALALDRLNDPVAALGELEPVLAAGEEDEAACELVERIVRLPAAPPEARARALTALKARYEASGRSARVIPLLKAALELAPAGDRADLHRQMAERLAAAGDRPGAMEQLITLAGLEPGDARALERLRHLAELQADPRPYLRGLAAAAATPDVALRIDLWLEAARVQEAIKDPAAALALYRQVQAEPGAAPGARLSAARKLAELLGTAPQAEQAPGERLAVLESLAELSVTAPLPAEQRSLLVEVARLSEDRGDVPRAAAAFSKLLEIDPSDRTAVDGLVALYERARDWEAMVGALKRRISVSPSPEAIRADLMRVARVQAAELGQLPAAIDTWSELRKTYGEDAETVNALGELLALAGRWGELADLLTRAGETDSARLAGLYCRLGDVCREKLSDPARAAAFYARALDVNPAHGPAQSGARALLELESSRVVAAEALARAHQAAGDWRSLASLCEVRLMGAPDDGARVRLLREAAFLYERKGEDPLTALTLLARALPLAPDDGAIEGELARLAGWTRETGPVIEALRAAGQATRDPLRVSRLRFQEGQFLEARGDAAAAQDAYRAAFVRDPARLELREALVRTAARTGDWALAAQTALAPEVPRDALERSLLPLLEALAAECSAHSKLADAAATVLQHSERGADPALARDLEAWVARQSEAAGGEAGAQRAEAALLRAALYARRVREAREGSATPSDGLPASELVILRRLAAAQRSRPTRALCDTLVALADLSPNDLDPLEEAAALALGPLQAEPLATTILGRLLDQATRLLRTEQVAAGSLGAAKAAAWAAEELARLELSRPDKSAWARAVELLLDAARLPLPRPAIRGLRWRVAGLALDKLRDRRLAIQVLRQMVDEDVQDTEAVTRLGALYEEERRLPELLALRQEELARTLEVERRLALRLELEKIASALEERSGRLDVLRANLDEQPGHWPTIETLARLLESRHRHAELVEVLSDQATRVEERGERPAAGKLWGWIARLLVQPLADRDRAIRAYERVAELDPTPVTFEALGRLLLEKNDPLRAAPWLERWQNGAEGATRTQAALELAGAYLRADQRAKAVACLERALADDPAAAEVRRRLIDLHRSGEAWDALVRVLNDGALQSQEPETILGYAREAADIAANRLSAPEAALAALERAVELAPQDSALRSLYAEALFAAGGFRQARTILEALIQESGRRRSKERAILHLRVARVARAERQPGEALEHLEQAAEMDMDSAATLETLAEVAEETGELERAERAYRALMLLLRRGGKGGSMSPTEALLRLRQITISRGQSDKAQDLLDSAVAESIGHPEEARRLGRALRDRGELDVLAQVLEKRLSAATDPGERASILVEQADIAAGQGKAAQALDTALAALSEAPQDAAVRAAASRTCRDVGASDRYATALLALAGEKRRSDDAQLSAAWLSEAGQVLRDEVKDPAAAAEAYARAAQLGAEGGVAAVQAAHALAGLAGARGDSAERSRAIKILARLGRAVGAPPEVRTEALFRYAQAQLAANESVEQALSALSAALELSSDIERAFTIVREAKVADADLARVLPLYEHVARASKDDNMLLDFYQRRSALPGITLEQVREGIEFAVARDRGDRARALLERAVPLARSSGNREGLQWAILELAEARRAAGDIAGAVTCLEEGRDVADPVRIMRIYQDIGRGPLEGKVEPAVVAKVYERLWEREPGERRAWEPLLRVYLELRDAAGIERVTRATVERLFDPAERNAVRMLRARFLAQQDRKDPALVETLRDVLLDEPTLEEAITLLADVYQASGNEQGLTELLASEIEAARARRDVPAVVALSLRLGGRQLSAGNMGEARDVYRKALLLAPDDRQVLRALAELLSPQEDARERAVVLERLLGSETGDEAGRLAIELALLWEAMGDEERVQRALETGAARADGSVPVFDRLCEFYRSRHAWDRLASALVEESERRKAPADKAALLRQAADLQRNSLGRGREAAELLRKARKYAPEDAVLLTELVQALDALGEGGLAAEELSQALGDLPADNPHRVPLLQARAELYEKSGHYENAVQDREAALAAGGEGMRPALRAAMERWRAHTSQRGDAGAERRAMRHLTDFLIRGGEEADARAVLADWCYRHPEDSESLRSLVARDLAAGRWEAVVESAFRLIEAETGEGQISAAELLVEACERMGQPTPAIAGLESALRTQPGNAWLFEKLMGLYEKVGERRKQAALLSWAGERSPDPEIRFRSLRQAGEILLKEKDLERASAAFQQALALKPTDRELSWLVADVCIASGRLGEAEEILQMHMKKAAKDLSSTELSSLQHRMAQLAEARGDQAGRFDWLRRAFETNRKDGVVAAELADLAEASNDIDLAVKALRAVTLAPPTSGRLTPAMAFLRQARIAQRSGDRPKAVIFAKRALQEDPRLHDAAEFLKEMGERRV